MKKLLTVLCSLCLAVFLFALSACGGSGVDGTIKGDYKEADAESFTAASAVLAEAKFAKDDATAYGLSFNSDAEASFTFDGKTAKITENESLSLIIAENITAAMNAELTAKADKGFINTVALAAGAKEGEVPDFGKIDVSVKGDVYYSNGNIYVNGKIAGISDIIETIIEAEGEGEGAEAAQAREIVADMEKGVKYVFPKELVSMLIGNFKPEALDETSFEDISANIGGALGMVAQADFETINTALGTYGFKLYIDSGANGLKIKLATTADAKTTLGALVAGLIGEEDDVSDFVFKTLNLEIYVAFDADGVLTQVAFNADVDITAKLFGKTAELKVNGAANLSVAVPEIKLPSFDGYTNPMMPSIEA